MKKEFTHYYESDVKDVFAAYRTAAEEFGKNPAQQPDGSLTFDIKESFKYNTTRGKCTLRFVKEGTGVSVSTVCTASQIAGARFEKFDKDLSGRAAEVLAGKKMLRQDSPIPPSPKKGPRPYEGERPYIFFSYSHKDDEAAHELISELQKRYNVWFDNGLHVGQTWEDELAERIMKCSLFVYFITENSLASEYCKNEIHLARNEGKNFVNIQLKKDEPLPAWFKLSYSRYQSCFLDDFATVYDAVDALGKRCGYLAGVEIDIPRSVAAPLPTTRRAEYFEPLLTPPDIDGAAELRKRSALVGELHHDISPCGRVNGGFMSVIQLFRDETAGGLLAAKFYVKTKAEDTPFMRDPVLAERLIAITCPELARIFEISTETPAYALMEYVEGVTLEQYFRERLVRERESLGIFKCILKGLIRLHENGIFYGDLTPSNVIVTGEHRDRAALCDFSSSNFNGSRYGERTVVFNRFMSPDRQNGSGGVIDFRSDIYEAGVLLDYLTLKLIEKTERDLAAETGGERVYLNKVEEHLESGLTVNRLKADHFFNDPVNRALYEMIKRATKYDPKDRYTSAEEMLREIERIEGLY